MMLLSLFSKPRFLFLLGVLAGTLMTGTVALWTARGTHQALGACEQGKHDAQAAVAAQEQAVAQLINAAQARQAAVDAATAQAAQKRAELERQVGRLLTTKVPKECPEAVAWGAQWGSAKGQSWSAQ